MGIKAENEFSPLYPHSPATVARDARPSHPSPYRKKSRFAKKKSAPPKKTRLPQKKLQHRMEGMPLHPPPPPTQCYPLDSFYSPPHSTIRQRINCRSASFFGSCFATAVPHLSGVTTHDTVPQAIGAVFFRRSRLFFREAAFFSGGEGCEWGAKQPTVGESGDKAENEFSGFIPLVIPRKGFSPHIPASRLFVLLHPSKA